MHAYDFESGDFGYNVISLDEMTCELAGVINECPSHVTIPESATYKGRVLKVVKIGKHAFYNCKSSISITFPNSITEISMGAFYGCTSLISVSLPSSLKKIGNFAFEGCASLTTIDIPNSIDNISFALFKDCTSLITVNLPNSITWIDGEAFDNCKSMTSITLPNNLNGIGKNAFRGTAIISLDIPDSVHDIEYNSFDNCAHLKEIVIGSGVPNLTDTKIEGFGPDPVTSYIIGCENLQRLIIKDSKKDFMIHGSDKNCMNSIMKLPLNELYLGRRMYSSQYARVGNNVVFESLQKIIFGLNFDPQYEEDTWINLRKLPITATIYCKNPVPNNYLGSFFSNEQYLNCVLYVPTESIDVYKNAEGWKNFWDIRGFDFSSGIEDVTKNTRDVYNVYNIHGNYILRTRKKEDLNNLQKGIYIINGKKIIIP